MAIRRITAVAAFFAVVGLGWFLGVNPAMEILSATTH